MCRRLCLAEGEHVCLGARLKELDLKRPLADSVVLAYELVEAAIRSRPFPVMTAPNRRHVRRSGRSPGAS